MFARLRQTWETLPTTVEWLRTGRPWRRGSGRTCGFLECGRDATGGNWTGNPRAQYRFKEGTLMAQTGRCD
jgi:hypothetical protein